MTADARLAYIDQATFLSWQATGRRQLVQFAWVYHRPVDMAAIGRLHDNLARRLAGRLIEPSILPFGRHRWVDGAGAAAAIDVSDERSPDALGEWIEERSQVPVHPVLGPGWHVAVLPMSDGSTAVTVVFSHCLVDGGAALSAVADAVDGDHGGVDYLRPRSRTRRAALASDTGRLLSDVPELGRTAARAVRFAYRRRGEIRASGASRPAASSELGGDVVVPAVSAIIDVRDWDARAADLGGTTYALLAGFATRLAVGQGRVGPSGTVTLLIAKSDRVGADDHRANAMQICTAAIDPAEVTTDLTAARSAVRSALSTLGEEPDETHALLPLTPFVPKRAVRMTADVIFGDLPVACSNVGEVPAGVARPDGTDADMVIFRPVDQNVSRSDVERAGGQLVVAAGRVAGTVSIGIVAYQVGAANTRGWLSDHVTQVLADYGLKGVIV